MTSKDVGLDDPLQLVALPPVTNGTNGVKAFNLEESTPIGETPGKPEEPDTLSKSSGAKEKIPSASYLKLFSTSDCYDWVLMFIGTTGAMANGAAMPLFALVFGKLLNTIGNDTSNAELASKVNSVVLYFVYLAAGTFVASYVEVACWMLTGARQANRIREKYLASVLRQEVAYFDVHVTTGELLQGLNEDINAVQNAISEKVGTFLHHFFTFVVGMTIAFIKGWDMALVLLSVVPVLVIVVGAIGTFLSRSQKQASAAYGEANSIAQEALAAIRTVLAFNSQDTITKRYSQALSFPEKVGIRSGFFNGVTVGAINCTFMCAYALALWYGGKRVRDGDYNGGQVITVLFSALIGGMSLGLAGPNIPYFQAGTAAAGKIFALVDRKPKIDDEDPGESPSSVQGALELSGIHFAYPVRSEVSVFSGFSLSVPAGKTVALVGESGSGKSTVVQLVERFYDPDQGSVSLDGIDIRKLQLSWYRQQVGLVSQEPTLFATSIYNNILYGKPGASEEEVANAARAANAHDFISALPKGYHTQVGEHGIQMSGGQKQRIAIARAILKNPPVLLLDEATSALDAESEKLVQNALEGMMTGRTTIVVAHRLSTIMNADTVAVLKRGTIVEQGSPKELMAIQDGAFFSLVKLQRSAQSEMEGGTTGAAKPEVFVGSKTLLEHEVDPLEDIDGVRPSSFKKTSFKKSTKTVKLAPEDDEDSEEYKKRVRKNATYKRLLAMNKPETGYLIFGSVASAGQGMLMPSFALSLSSVLGVYYITDYNHMAHEISKWALIFVGTGVGSLICCTFQQYCFTVCGQRLTRRVRVLLLGSVLNQELGWFDRDENSSGAIAGRLSLDTTHIRGAVGDQIGLVAQNLVTVIAGYIIAFTAGWRMTLVVTACVPVLGLATWIHTSFMLGVSNKADELFGQANQTAAEAFLSIRTVAAFRLGPQLLNIYRTQLAKPMKALRWQCQISGFSFGFSQGVLFAVYAISFWYGAQQIQDGQMSFTGMLKVFFAIFLAAMGVSQAQMSFPDLTKAKGAIIRVFGIVDRKTKIDSSDNAPGTQLLADVSGDVELRDVTFSYPSRPEVTVFKGFNLRVGAGQSLALVGQSGSGKSTVVGLILRFYDPQSGQVLVDGKDVKEMKLRSLRAKIGLVSQEPVLFSATIAENIAYGRPEATREEIKAAAEAANAASFIEQLPEGFDSQVGESGIQLSGGQKQRVAIARAILKNPRIMLLDEATSALDAESERLVQSALDNIMKGRTVVIIAHRLSTIRNANSIAVVQQGQILEMGTHEELMQNVKGPYAGLVRHQQQH